MALDDHPRRVLIVSDLSPSNQRNIAWIAGLAAAVQRDGREPVFVARVRSAEALHEELRTLGASVDLGAVAETEDTSCRALDLSVFARHVGRLARDERVDEVLAQGQRLLVHFASQPGLRTKLWSFVDEDPMRSRPLSPAELKQIPAIAAGSKRIVVGAETTRSQIEARCPNATSKTRLIGAIELPRAARGAEGRPLTPVDALVLDFSLFAAAGFRTFALLSRRLQLLRTPPQLIVTDLPVEPGETEAPLLDSLELALALGGRTDARNLLEADVPTGALVAVPAGLPAPQHAYAVQMARRAGCRIAIVEDERQLAQLAADTDARLARDDEPSYEALESFAGFMRIERPDYHAVPRRAGKLKVLLAGSDFKFAGDLVETLAQRHDIELRVDLFESNAKPQPAKSEPLRAWADVVIAEFAAKNAIWYSQRMEPHQRLIVHLHGYELLQEWIDELDVSNVARIVVASEFYRAKALEMKGWDPDKVVVVPNSVNPADLDREKLPDARFHLGLVGIVPILKRPDRALDLLERLLEIDPRFTLHIRGHAPWNYNYEWKKAAHQDSYRAFYDRLRTNPALASRLAFEPFGPDMGNWLRKIGWLLSSSTRETFHMAAIEGATSGAPPIAWRREGSTEIIGEFFNIDDLDEAVELIASATGDDDRYARVQAGARRWAARYATPTVREKWLKLVFALADGDVEVTQRRLDELEGRVRTELELGDTEGALGVLDEHIPLTRDLVGPVKSLELFVRGIAALDARRFSLFQPPLSPLVTGGNGVLAVRGESSGAAVLTTAGLDRRLLDVRYPVALSTDRERTTIDGDIQPDYATRQLLIDDRIRFDRWVHVVKTEIEHAALDDAVSAIVVDGAWWLALAASLAGDELGLPVTWHLEDAAPLDAELALTANPASGDELAQLAAETLRRVDVRVSSVPAVVEHPRAARCLDAAVGLPAGASGAVPAWSGTRFAEVVARGGLRRSSPPAELARELRELRLAVIADEATVRELEGLVSEVTRVAATDCLEQIEPWHDALLVFAEGDEDGPWAGRLSPRQGEGTFPLVKLQDRARQVGVPAVFVTRSEGSLAAAFTHAAEKADVLAARSWRDVEHILVAHPISARAFARWDTRFDLAWNLAVVLRSAGIGAEGVPPVVRGPHVESDPDDASIAALADATDDSLDLSGERVSLVLATRGGRDRIGAMLDSIAAQTLPPELIEVLVVENGEQDGTEAIVSAFAARNTEITVRYFFEPRGGVGHARNLALEHAGGAYVTFVDDDDELEPEFLRALWLSAGDDVVVTAPLVDVEGGERSAANSNNSALEQLGARRLPIGALPSLLGMGACKLLPARAVQEMRYNPALLSGEDVDFLAQLLAVGGLALVRGAPMAEAAYVRHRRPGSLSRPKEMSFDFDVAQRLEVIESLEARVAAREEAVDAIRWLQRAQFGFVTRYLAANPDDRAPVEEAVRAANLPPGIVPDDLDAS